jgi:hypothetical protein
VVGVDARGQRNLRLPGERGELLVGARVVLRHALGELAQRPLAVLISARRARVDLGHPAGGEQVHEQAVLRVG